VYRFIQDLAAEVATQAGKSVIMPTAWRVAARQWLMKNGLIRIQKAGEVSPNFCQKNDHKVVEDHRHRRPIGSTPRKRSGGDADPIAFPVFRKGNKGYRRYVKIEKDSASIDFEKVKTEARLDGKWVLRTNTDLPTEKVALKYEELWQVERVFRDVKSMLETRPIFHQRDDTIRWHVFCSFLALVLRKELERHFEKAGHNFEWSHIKQDLQALQETHIEENGNQLAIRSKAEGVCGKVFQAVGMAMPPTIREY
jgi:hypothetical protein